MRCRDDGMEAAPAGEGHDLALGRFRGPARPALGPVCEELAGLGQGRKPHVPGSAARS